MMSLLSFTFALICVLSGAVAILSLVPAVNFLSFSVALDSFLISGLGWVLCEIGVTARKLLAEVRILAVEPRQRAKPSEAERVQRQADARVDEKRRKKADIGFAVAVGVVGIALLIGAASASFLTLELPR